MSKRDDRVQALIAMSKRLQRCGPTFLATLLVDAVYQLESLHTAAFDDFNQDEAVLRVLAKLEPMVYVSATQAPIQLKPSRKPRALRKAKAATIASTKAEAAA